MEPPPFHHNHRYVPISPPRFPGDRSIYHHQLLPPSPRPPRQPPLPLLYHHHHHHQPIDRQHPFDVDHPTRVSISDRIIFDHHKTPFLDEHPHLRHPEFNNPDTWNQPPPKVSPQRPRTFPIYWENESPSRNAHPLSPYRTALGGNFIARKRFVDDQESAPFLDYPIDGLERNQNDDIFLDQSDIHVSTSGSDNDNYFQNRISFANTMSSRNHALPASNRIMHFDFKSDNRRSWKGSGAGYGLDEGRIWVSAMPNSRDTDCFVHGIEEIICEDDIRVVSQKRFPRIGKFSNKVGGERSKKIVHRKKKQQKKSALQRIQLGKATSRKLHYSAYFDNLNSGSYRSKGPLVFSEQRLEEERVSPVELDVSFKSNALVVAKAVMAPSGTVVGSSGSSTTKIKRIKKVTRPVSVSSSSRLTEFHEGPLSADGSSLGVDDPITSDNGPMLSEEKHTVSGTGVIEDIGSRPCPSEVNVSNGKRAKEGSPVAMASSKASIDVNVSHDGKFTRKIMKKKKIMASSSSLSISQGSEISTEPRNADQSTNGVAAILSPDTGRMVSGHKTSMSAVQEIKNVGLQPCPNTATVLLVKDSVQGSAAAMVSDKEDTKIVPAFEFAPSAKKIKKDMGPCLGLSSSWLSEIHVGPVNTNRSACDADIKSDAAKNPIHLDKRGAVSDAMPADDVVSHCCTDGPTALLECSVVEGSTEVIPERMQDCSYFLQGLCKLKHTKSKSASQRVLVTIHDPTKVAVCKKFLKGLCNNTNCKLTHKVIPERMQDCSYFLQGLCKLKHTKSKSVSQRVLVTIHDPTKVAACKKFLKGLCNNTNCKLTHKVIPERMQDCSYFLQGLCTNENCPYRHVNVNPSAPVCEGFLRGYCADGDECHKKHSYVCPVFDATGICPQESMCKLHHLRNQYEGNRRRRSNDQKSKKGRYFGSSLTAIAESCSVASIKQAVQNNEDIFFHAGRFVDYISLDFSNDEAGEANNATDMHAILCGSDQSKLASDDLDDLIEPVHISNRNLM